MPSLNTSKAQISRELDPQLPFLIRLDGHKFSTFTKSFSKPWDPRISEAMKRTSIDLLNTFSPSTVFTASDEITLVFRPVFQPDQVDRSIPYKGKVQKFVSLTAGMASARFNYYLSQFVDPTASDEANSKLASGTAYFDSRLFHVPDDIECVHNLLFRIADTCRNSISLTAKQHFSQKVLNFKSSEQVISLLKEINIDWHTFPEAQKYGLLFKRKIVNKKGFDLKLQQEVITARAQTGIASASVLFNVDRARVTPVILAKHLEGQDEFYPTFRVEKTEN